MLLESESILLLRAIADAPDDDTLRLIYADWLEEHSECAWGELIRVQVELARMETYSADLLNDDTPWSECTELSAKWCPNCGDCICLNPEASLSDADCPLHSPTSEHCCHHELMDKIAAYRARESALLAEHEPRLRRGERCERCENGTYEFFPSSNLPPRKKKCPFCRGTGWERWWLAERRLDYHLSKCTKVEWRHRVHFVRGFPEQVDANLRDIMDADGNPTEWALACVRGEPGLRRFGVVDRPAWQGTMDDSLWYTVSGVVGTIERRLSEIIRKNNPKGLYGHDSPAAANTALATAAWQCVREQISG